MSPKQNTIEFTIKEIKDNVKIVKCQYPELGDCWECYKPCNKKGYSHIRFKGKTCRTHRVMWTIVYGNISDGLWVLHKCDNPPCCNPYHLKLGNNYDNVQDCIRNGRTNYAKGDKSGARLHPEKVVRGENNGRAKLKEQDIIAIFKLRKEGLSQEKIAKIFNIHQVTVSDILRRNVWKHIKIPKEYELVD